MRSPWSPLVFALVAFVLVGAVPLASGHPPGGVPAPSRGSTPAVATLQAPPRPPTTSPSWSVAQTLVLFNNTTEPGNFAAINGGSADDVAFDAGTDELFMAEPTQGAVSVFSAGTDRLVATIPVADPRAVVYDPGKGQVFVTSDPPYPSDGFVSVISDVTDGVVGQVAVGAGPMGIAYDPGMGEVFAANSKSDNVSVINDTSDSIVASVPVNDTPEFLAFDNGTGDLFAGPRICPTSPSYRTRRTRSSRPSTGAPRSTRRGWCTTMAGVNCSSRTMAAT